jgi:hypothetical protein
MNAATDNISFRAVLGPLLPNVLGVAWAFLTACSGSTSEMDYLSAVKRVNHNWSTFPVDDERFMQFIGYSKVWKNLPVPVYGQVDVLVVSTIERINAKTGISLLVVSDQLSGPGIRISYGTAVQPKNHKSGVYTKVVAKGTVSGEVDGWGYPNGFPLDGDGNIDGEIVLNLQAREKFNDSDMEGSIHLVAHEFGHALGLFDHVPGAFNGSGGPPITNEFYALLDVLYKK